MSKRTTSSSDLERLAKAKMPKWRVAQEQEQDSSNSGDVDAVSPNLFELRSKSKATAAKKLRTGNAGGESDSGSKTRNKGLSGLVNMAPGSGRDANSAIKTQIFEDDEHTGSQG
jgi:hypothetical protein